jgi:hypothetical protein
MMPFADLTAWTEGYSHPTLRPSHRCGQEPFVQEQTPVYGVKLLQYDREAEMLHDALARGPAELLAQFGLGDQAG